MAINIRNFGGLNHSLVPSLWAWGLRTNEDILARTATRQDRQTMAQALGVEEEVVLELACRADLARVKGIGNLYAGLLGKLQIRCVPDLARQEGEALYRSMEELNAARQLTKRLPRPKSVDQWVAVAKTLPMLVEL